MKFTIYGDGGARGNPGPAAAAFVVIDQNGRLVHREGKFLGKATNNQAEYQAVIAALSWLARNAPDGHEVVIKLDSQLLVSQLRGEFKIKNKTLSGLIMAVKEKEKRLKVAYQLISREENKLADFLVNQVLDENLR